MLNKLDDSIASVRYAGWGVNKKLLDEDELIRELKGVDIFISEYETISSHVIESSDHLKIIACCRNEPHASIDVETATELGIPVLFPPGRNSVSVAEFAFGFMLSLSRNIHKVDHLIKHTKELTRIPYRSKTKGRMNVPSEWSFDARAPMHHYGGPELAGKTLGIIGIGAIGSQVSTRANAFQMKVITHDPYVSDEHIESFGAKREPLENLLQESDYILMSARVRDDNRHLVNEESFRLMKPSAYFVNIARAHLVDYDALYDALKEKRIAGAALDVYPSEPIPEDYPFIGLDNIILSPHLAGASPDIVKNHTRMVVEDISLMLKGQRPQHLYNPESWEKCTFKRDFKS